MATYTLKPFVINLNDLAFLLNQVNFVPLFDAPQSGNGIIAFDGTVDAYSSLGVKLWDATNGITAEAQALGFQDLADLGTSFPQVSAPIGIRDPSGFYNNLFGSQADWGAADVPFVRQIAADYTNYVTGSGFSGDYGAIGTDIVDMMPRIISRTITTGGVNLLTDSNGHFVDWDAALYASDTAYALLVDSSGVNIAQLVEGAKIIAPLTTEIAALDAHGDPLIWSAADYTLSGAYATTLAVYSQSSFGGLFGSATGDPLVDGGQIFAQLTPGVYTPVLNLTYEPDLLAYRTLVNAAQPDFGILTDGDAITTTLEESGYGLLETLGHVDFQQPDSGEFFIGSENPGVNPVNMWFGIFGQFFDHGLDFIGKGNAGTITIALDPSDPLYNDAPNHAITVSRATPSGVDANGDAAYVNHTSPFIDQSQTYGSIEQITNILREWVSTDSGNTFHAGIELFDGTTLVDTWTRRWPDGTTSEVNDTLPTLNELRAHVLATDRTALSWEDVNGLRVRDEHGNVSLFDSNGQALAYTDKDGVNHWYDSGNTSTDFNALSAQSSGHALLLDMNPRFDGVIAGEGHITQASIDKLNDALGLTGTAGEITPASFNIGLVMPYLNPDFSINATGALHDAISDVFMDSVGDHYIAGDGRVNENFGLTSIHHVFHEEHNYQVENLKVWIYAHDANNPGSTDVHEGLHAWQIDTGTQDGNGNYLSADGSIAWEPDKMFEATKLIVEMEYQHAAVDQYARTVTPRIQEFVGYSTGVDSTISLEYAQVAFRFGHSTIRETIDTIDPSGWLLGNVTKYALEKAFLAPETFAEEGIAAITLGLTRAQMNEVDEFVTPALSQGLLDMPLDLPAINIARARDLGIPTLNDFRDGIGLARYTSWTDFGANMFHSESLVNFIAAYSFEGDVAKAQTILDLADGTATAAATDAFGGLVSAGDAVAFLDNNDGLNTELNAARAAFEQIDSWIGGLAEVHVPGGLLGETFDAVFVAQIQSLMDGDRFYYLYRLFGTQIHEEVNNGQFKDLVERNTGLVHLNGSIFGYADKYYDFGLNSGQDKNVADDFANHLYVNQIEAEQKGIFSDGGNSTANNGLDISVVAATDGIRGDVTLDLIRDIRVNENPDLVHPVEGTPTDGADSHEVIVGTEFADYIHGRAGDDTIYGDGGDDFIFGDGGADRSYGGDGDDVIDTGEGPDLADGGAGKDIIFGRGSGSEVGGFDQLVGGSGNDLLVGGEGIDKLSGGSGDDIIYGDGLTNPEMGNTDPFTHAGDGNDYVDGGASGDLIFGEEGDDYLVGGADQDLIQGGIGDDIIRPGAPSQASGTTGGPDEVVGDDAQANAGFDLIDLSDYPVGGPGVLIDFSTQTNPLVAIDQTTPFPAWFQIEGAIGTSGSDTFIGDSEGDATADNSLGNNWLIGGSGNDSFTGAGGNDLIIGGSIRLDSLIGSYAGADFGNLELGSLAWIADAMQTGGSGTGYDNNYEDAYTGASNRAEGPIGTNGLIDAANALGGGQFDKHFTDMLSSRMFKDVVLGDNGTDGTSDTAVFTGNRADYLIQEVSFQAPNGEQITAYKITDNGHASTGPNDPARDATDGTDLLVGVEFLTFADGTISTTNAPPTNIQWNARTPSNNNLPGNNNNIADLTATDPGGTSWSYQILPGSSSGFQVTGGDSIRKTGGGMGSNQTYNLNLRVTDDGGATHDETFTIRTGSNGNNTIDEGASTNDVILYGDDGNDTLIGGSGNDTLFGQDENDSLMGGGGNDVLHGGSNDTDTAIFSGPVANYSFAQAGAGSVIVTDTVGTDGTDTLIDIEQVQFGTANNAPTYNLVTGNNSINGSNGQDLIIGNNNNNAIDTNRGDDIVFAGGGDDTIEWNVTNPFFIFPELRDGHDIIDGGANTATGDRYVINGNNTDETYRVYARAEAILAGLISTAAAAEIVITRNGTTANDVIAELTGIEEITINTFGGNDSVLAIGNFSPTQLFPNTITVNGGSGQDMVDITALTSDHRVVFNTGGNGQLIGDPRLQDVVNTSAAGQTDDRAAPTQHVQGTSGADRLGGSAAGDRFAAGSGNDLAWGGAGNDDMMGANGADRMFGGDGSDKIFGGNGHDMLSGNGGNDMLYGGAGNDGIWGQSGDDLIVGGGGHDRLSGQNGNDIIRGGAGNDTISGGAGNDQISGGSGNDAISGNSGDDLLTGDSGADTIDGGTGNDRIFATLGDGDGDSYDGGADIDTLDLSGISSGATVDLEAGTLTSADTGTDQLANIENVVGSTGNDTIIANDLVNVFFGGAGEDSFVFHSAAAADGDQITDFQAGDRIDLSGMNGGQALDLMSGPTFNAAGQVIVVHETDANGVEHTILQGNLDNDNAADFTIDILGNHNLTTSDFVGVA